MTTDNNNDYTQPLQGQEGIVKLSTSPMAKPLPLLRGGSVSLEEALADDDNVLHRLDYPQKQKKFWLYLVSHKSDIEAIVRFHLRVNCCRVFDESQWLFGSYNVCIPVSVNLPSDDRVLFRIPLPFKIGEANNPGNVDEKLRCEVATYIWIRENCPTVPIPSLYGFAFSNGQTVCNSGPIIIIPSPNQVLNLVR